MPRDPRREKVARLHRERRTRAAGRFYGTRVTAYGDLVGGPQQRDTGRVGLALVLLVGLGGVLLYVLGRVEVAPWLHLVLHAVGLDHGGPLPVHLR
jgi:hypothetical protein